jgi:NADP-dependent 3-hydroxy acid dehydrogenase YdfG
VIYPGAMATQWGAWSADERAAQRRVSDPREALPPENIAAFIAWIATAPRELVLDDVLVTPLHEQGYP